MKNRYFILKSRFACFDFERRYGSAEATDQGVPSFWGWHIWAGRKQMASPLRLHYAWTPRFFMFKPCGAERRLTLTTRRYAGFGLTLTTRKAKQR